MNQILSRQVYVQKYFFAIEKVEDPSCLYDDAAYDQSER